MRLFIATFGILGVIGLGIDAAAQDRVILFESYAIVDGQLAGPGELREIEIREGGRSWLSARSVPLPAHRSGPPVALSDGSRILWLVYLGDFYQPFGPSVLVQYDFASERLALVDVGHFESFARLVADRTAPRVFVIESNKVTIIDSTLRVASFTLPGPSRTYAADLMVDGHLRLERCCSDADERELVTVNVDARRIVRVFAFPQDAGLVRFSSDGRRMYRYYCSRVVFGCDDRRIDLVSTVSGELMARASLAHDDIPSGLFDVRDDRGALVYERLGRQGVVVRDAYTLVRRGELAPAALTNRTDFRLAETPTQRALLVFSQQRVPDRGGFSRPCNPPGATPRIDVFDGRTLEPVSRIDLQGRCPTMLLVPPRR